MRFTGKPEGVYYYVTNFGEVLLSDEEAKKASEIAALDNRSSKNRLMKQLMNDFISLVAEEEEDLESVIYRISPRDNFFTRGNP